MNRQNFVPHLALAVTLVFLAAFVGQMRHWKKSGSPPNIRTTEPGSRGCSARHLEMRPTAPPVLAATNGPDEVLVRFKSGVSQARIEAIVARFHDSVEDRIENVNGLVAIEDFDADVDAEAVAKEYAALSDAVDYAEPNYAINLDPTENQRLGNDDADTSDEIDEADTPNDPMFAEQWSLVNQGQKAGKEGADIKALAAWSKTKGSAKVVVAVLDSGVDYTHEDLAPNMWIRPDTLPAYEDAELGLVDDLNGFDAADLGDPMDDNGHGTHCAGIIGASGDNGLGIAGINWKVSIMPLKFIGRNGSGTTKAAIEAINYVIQRKKAGVNVRIISASWGSTQRSKALEDAIRRAGDEGILFIAASGNDSADADKRPHYPSGYKLPNVISVAALDRSDALASFSNYGAKSVHIAAPGKDIMSSWLNNGYREASGTSMATPEVSGVAALILAQSPKMTVAEVRARLFKSVDPLPGLAGKVVTGGRLNAAKAVGAE